METEGNVYNFNQSMNHSLAIENEMNNIELQDSVMNEGCHRDEQPEADNGQDSTIQYTQSEITQSFMPQDDIFNFETDFNDFIDLSPPLFNSETHTN